MTKAPPSKPPPKENFDEVTGAWDIVPRVVVVDDSASSRAAIAEMLEDGGCDVVGRAMDGGMALKLCLELEPDVVTCDLEMPRMDGFTFIRVLSQRMSTPVIVVTSDARPEAALQALDLGARDFVVKPGRGARDLKKLARSLVGKVRGLAAESAKKPTWTPPADVPQVAARELVVIGASTGGPSALRDVLGSLTPGRFAPVLIAQHMPERFTAAFAARLSKATGLDVAEATDGELVVPGRVRLAAGGTHMEVRRSRSGELVLRVLTPDEEDRHAPSVDRLFRSAAEAVGTGLLGVVLTGMGRDGADGARELGEVGAPLWAESRATAVIHGMPKAAARAHGAALQLPLDELASLFGRVVGLTAGGGR
jgi:two-component system chemotaxis response regulator CheB